MGDEKVVTIHERIPSLKEQRKQRANRRLIFFLSFFFLLLLLVIYFQSPLSHIRSIKVEGNQFVDDETIIEASKLSNETSIWSISDEQLKANVESLEEVEAIEWHRVLPNTVVLEVKEYERVAYLFQEDQYFPILESGSFLSELPKYKVPADAPILVNWDQLSLVKELAAELNEMPDRVVQRISEIYHTPNDGDPLRITLYMNDGLIVQSTIRQFAEYMAPYPVVVKELDPDAEGILHMRMSPYFESFNIPEEEEDQEVEVES
ncbi:cell division protein FtsQ/DivIB [Halalkalibacterium halodurans]|uniref:Cell division protein DivIB n=1 Tax=Halalkalibacterium halodurans (strain ATCC BAA-125 / DSM 18197 / FERM 7344 / JCM 9153 / C-125) TaxID=272558 RepID=Q9K9T2_HALH5|nr:cell division protein FtsQ/DivIB [Halalkalibacterium halodurans]MDY7223100.1 cell division protein FtsQ/DivIB [Halalkalibacterium halodurans]MDY7242321.1 cell division protein FtsQ/DivIB [Halalkalibacterium halodurans]MED4079708.1 cell division protein FtsQ/DivIB [Halalkalibacterium halodurans]MED4086350.1 cell division protein FtsQ/DivIB [Halalkalibacterium halodurans]MED4103305.1 cell division protein FtsQ/DivIB [Halalkalibacterium halodurans]